MNKKISVSVCQWKMQTPLGPIYLVASPQGLRGVWWKKQSSPSVASLQGKTPALRHLARAARQLQEYFTGKRQSFDLTLDPTTGTQFQRAVWQALTHIPYGQTWSYRQLAVHIGKPKAVRAVGSANGRNPLSVLVPCHRVIATGGGLGGYAGGLKAKAKLLALESAHVL